MDFTNTHPALADFWHPVALSAEVADHPVGVRLAGQGWVLARIDGAVAAFPDTCPHRRARLSAGRIVDGTLQCRYHGWRYSVDGACVEIPALGGDASIPARASLASPAAVAEQDGLVWLAPRPPRAPRPVLPALPSPDADVATVMMPAIRVPANAAILVDNFLDEAHLPFVHAATIGGAGPEIIERADVDRQGLAFTAVREHNFSNLTDPGVRDGTRPAVQRRRMTYGYEAPLHATLLLEYLGPAGSRGDDPPHPLRSADESWQFLTFTVQPEDEQVCRVFQTLTGPGMADPAQADSAVDYEMSIFAEDLDLQREALSGLEFPLDPAAELHTRADRVCVEFRRILAEAVKV